MQRRLKLQLKRFLFSFGAIVVLYLFYAWLTAKREIKLPSHLVNKTLILDWTGFFGMKLTNRYLDGCPELKQTCDVISDRYFEPIAHALLFHLPNIVWDDLPRQRQKSQRYVFFSHESAANSHIDKFRSKNYFNWTMAIRSDSDVPWPYARTLKIPPGVVREGTVINGSELLAKKTKNIGWFVSNCMTAGKREIYVKRLADFTPIDIYGSCGPLKCPKEKSSDCYSMLERDYKFYLAFENSFCKDYVTEKVWRTLNMNVVIVLLKGKQVKNLLPPNSFIGADEFKTPQELVKFLEKVGSDGELYGSYFKWRQDYRVVGDDTVGNSIGMCRLCEMLQDKNLPPKIYPDVHDWWEGEGGGCDSDIVTRLLSK